MVDSRERSGIFARAGQARPEGIPPSNREVREQIYAVASPISPAHLGPSVYDWLTDWRNQVPESTQQKKRCEAKEKAMEEADEKARVKAEKLEAERRARAPEVNRNKDLSSRVVDGVDCGLMEDAGDETRLRRGRTTRRGRGRGGHLRIDSGTQLPQQSRSSGPMQTATEFSFCSTPRELYDGFPRGRSHDNIRDRRCRDPELDLDRPLPPLPLNIVKITRAESWNSVATEAGSTLSWSLDSEENFAVSSRSSSPRRGVRRVPTSEIRMVGISQHFKSENPDGQHSQPTLPTPLILGVSQPPAPNLELRGGGTHRRQEYVATLGDPTGTIAQICVSKTAAGHKVRSQLPNTLKPGNPQPPAPYRTFGREGTHRRREFATIFRELKSPVNFVPVFWKPKEPEGMGERLCKGASRVREKLRRTVESVKSDFKGKEPQPEPSFRVLQPDRKGKGRAALVIVPATIEEAEDEDEEEDFVAELDANPCSPRNSALLSTEPPPRVDTPQDFNPRFSRYLYDVIGVSRPETPVVPFKPHEPAPQISLSLQPGESLHQSMAQYITADRNAVRAWAPKMPTTAQIMRAGAKDMFGSFRRR